MDKLQYDNLYKFLVSLGIVLIVLPVAALVFLFNMEPILISQADYDLLSDFSLQMIATRNKLTSYFISIFPWVAGILTCIGIVVLLIGIFKWVGLQKNLDKKLDAEAAIQTLNLLKMGSAEVAAKIEDEVNFFRLSMILSAGVEYNLGGSTSLFGAITFNNGFSNVFDFKNNIPPYQAADAINNSLELTIGMIF